MKRKILALAAVFSLLIALCACSSQKNAPDSSGKPIVAVSIVPEQTFVEAVCGDLAETVVMVPPGYSPENYEPTPQEMAKFSKASIYFTIGVPAEDTSILPSVAESTKVVPLADACAEVYDELKIDGGRDPHIWLSPKRAVVMVRTIAVEMSALDPENASIYSANAEAYISEIDQADAEIDRLLSGLENRSFIVFHPAFGYFADDYGLKMYALEQDGKEATAAELAKMIDFAKENGIKVIFYQAEIDSSQSRAFAEELGGVTVQLDPLSAEYTENLKTMARTLAEGMS
ncbi:MAG: zinc ABC transporter solute-binding protein [Clostridiales bacterium]|nr:zinc ABC transporter solute-binding protein [Clostridiales bacterium]